MNFDVSAQSSVMLIRKNVFTQQNSSYPSNPKCYRKFNTASVNKLNEDLSYRLSGFSFTQHNSVLFGNFLYLIFETCCKFCPIKYKQISPKHSTKPWLSNGLNSEI